MKDPLGNLSRRALFKIGTAAGAVALMGSSATSAFAARLNPKGKGKVFHLLTTNKLFEIDGKIIRDYNDAVDSILTSTKPFKSIFSIQIKE